MVVRTKRMFNSGSENSWEKPKTDIKNLRTGGKQWKGFEEGGNVDQLLGSTWLEPREEETETEGEGEADHGTKGL